MSRVLRTGLTGSPLTSNDHRLLFFPNDPEVTMAASPTLTAAPYAAPWHLPLLPVAAADPCP